MRRRAFLAVPFLGLLARVLPKPRVDEFQRLNTALPDYVHYRRLALVAHIQERTLQHLYRDALFPKLLFRSTWVDRLYARES